MTLINSSKIARLAIIFLVIVISSLATNVSYSQKATPLQPEAIETERSRYGLFLNLNLNQHNSDFLGTQLPFPSCCPRFEDGSGIGFSAGLLYELPLVKDLFLGIRAGYYDLSGILKAQENEIVYDYETNTEANGVFEHTLDSKISYIGIEPMINYRVWNELFLHIGANLGLLKISSDYSHKETILEPATGVFENNQRERLVADDVNIENFSSFMASVLAGVSYEIPLNIDATWIIAPEILYQYMFTNLVTTDNFDWKANALRLGASIKYAPTIFPPEPPKPSALLFGSVSASSLDKKGEEGSIVIMKVEEFLSTNVKPLLTYVFFDENSSKLPDRYKLLSPAQVRAFSVDDMFQLNNIETYHHILNIIGKRMRDFPDAKIAIDGCNSDSGPEKGNLDLSQNRAETVRNYLRDVWGIENERMVVGKRNLPQEPTNITEPDGIQENRRVEITSNKWEIIAPIFANDTFRTSTPPAVRFRSNINSEAGLKEWQLTASQNGKILQSFSGRTDIPKVLDWHLEQERDNIPRTSALLDYKMELTDNENQTFQTKTASLPVELVTVQKKRRERIKDMYIDRFSLILFSYDESALSYYNSKMGDIIKSVLSPNSKVLISGHTDRLGKEDYNLRLSKERANTVKRYLNYTNTDADGFGESNLIYDNNYPEGRFYSRRVDIIVQTPVEDKE